MNLSALTSHLPTLPAHHNVGDVERGLSLLGGAVALTTFLTHRSLRTAPLAAAGAALLFRGATGWCPVNAGLGRDSTNGRRVSAADAVSERTSVRRSSASGVPIDDYGQHLRTSDATSPEAEPKDRVQEASEESFPASDPPSFTPA